jgi:hypothetical protein
MGDYDKKERKVVKMRRRLPKEAVFWFFDPVVNFGQTS